MKNQPYKIPYKIRIGSIIYTVVMVDRIRVRNADGWQERFGEVDYVACEIRLCNYLTAETRFQVFVHECIHAMSAETPDSVELSEEQVSALSPYFAMFLLDNGFAEVEPLTKADTERREKALGKLYAEDTTHWVE